MGDKQKEIKEYEKHQNQRRNHWFELTTKNKKGESDDEEEDDVIDMSKITPKEFVKTDLNEILDKRKKKKEESPNHSRRISRGQLCNIFP